MKITILAVCLFFTFTYGAETSTKAPVEAPKTKAPATTKITPTAKTAAVTTKKTIPAAAAEGRKVDVSDAQLEMALKDKRYLKRQLQCTLGEAPCDPVGRRLKSLAPLVIRGSCPQCTPTEMRQIQKVLLHMQRNFPKEWAKVVRTYQ